MQHSNQTIENNNAFLMAMGSGSRIEIHAADASKDSWSQLDGTVGTGDTFITLSEETGWEVGDKIAIAASGGKQHHEERTIVSVSEDGMTFELDAPLEHYHYGEIDSYDNGLAGADRQVWDADMRAEVALLSRNVTIQGDEDSVEDGFGAHTMVMHGAEQHISGAEFFRVGQMDILGRYPVHWHMLGDVQGQYVENVSVHHSYQKGMTIHGSFNARLEDNVIFDHIGHGVFLEDGAEFGSQILYNLVFGTKQSETGQPIPTDRDQVSSYWIENASVTMIGNHAAGSEGTGMWILPAQGGAHGLSGRVFSEETFPDVSGGDLSAMVFRDNVTHSNVESGLFADGTIDRDTLEFRPGSIGPGLFQVENHTSYGNFEHGIWLRGADPRVDNAMLLDNGVALEVHSSSETILSNSLIVGDTANEAAVSDITGRETANIQRWDAGVHLYGETQLGLDGVHFETTEGHDWHAIRAEAIRAPEKATWLNDITLENVDHRLLWMGENFDINDKQSTNRIVDLDGSFTGTPGAFLTQDMILHYLDERTGFYGQEAGDGFHDTAISEGSSFGSVFLGRSNGTPFDITRSDGEKYDEYDSGTSTNATFLISTQHDQESAYLLELEDPERINLRVDGLRTGEAVVFEVPNVAGYSAGAVNAGDAPIAAVGSFAELFSSETSASYHSGDSLFIRVVMIADEGATFAGVDNDDNPSAAFITSEGTQSGFAFNLTPVDKPTPRGRSDFTPELLDWLDDAEGVASDFDIPDLPDVTPRDAPERFDSTSETIESTLGLPRWSDPDTWDGAPPGPGDVVVIDDGMQVVLDTSVEVAGIIVDGAGSALIIEDQPGKTIDLVADWVLVNDGALFQAGTESDPIDTDFTLTLTGDDPDFDLDVGAALAGMMPDTVFTAEMLQGGPIIGGKEADTILGGSGDDIIVGEGNDDELFGAGGNDTLRGGGQDDHLDGGAGDDLAFGSYGRDTLNGGDGNDVLEGNAHEDLLFGDSGADTLRGGEGNDDLNGGADNDVLAGGAGNDTLDGGAGQDILRGMDGADTFAFSQVADSAFWFADIIDGMQGVGVAGGDVIDLSRIDADAAASGDQAFTFIGQATKAEGLAGGAGTLWTETVGTQTRLFGIVDDDNAVDFAVRIKDGAVQASDYMVDDFIL